jgi:hypothetical protein
MRAHAVSTWYQIGTFAAATARAAWAAVGPRDWRVTARVMRAGSETPVLRTLGHADGLVSPSTFMPRSQPQPDHPGSFEHRRITRWRHSDERPFRAGKLPQFCAQAARCDDAESNCPIDRGRRAHARAIGRYRPWDRLLRVCPTGSAMAARACKFGDDCVPDENLATLTLAARQERTRICTSSSALSMDAPARRCMAGRRSDRCRFLFQEWIRSRSGISIRAAVPMATRCAWRKPRPASTNSAPAPM